MAAPRGLGGPGPHAEVHRHVEGVPRAQGTGQDEAFWSGGRKGDRTAGIRRCPLGGHCGGVGVGIQPETQAQIDGLWD